MAILLLGIGLSSAQTTSGEISGRVVDASGAVITGATVTLTNELTSQQLVTKTDSSGSFVFLGLQPGSFAVSIRAEGFKELTKRDLQLTASERLSAGNLRLEIGTTAQNIEVTAEATPVQTRSTERSADLGSKEIATLMTPGRDVLALTRLLPGVVMNDEGGDQLGTTNAGWVSGVRRDSNAVTVDGTTGNTRGGPSIETPLNMDAVGEVKLLLNNYQAEYGQSSGAIINLTTKSGTQQFHGSVYYYGRNEAFNANDWFNNNKGVARPQYRYNTVGYNLGGPVYIPGHFNRNKDKLFFFFSQERWPTHTPGTLQLFMMPTQAERNGDFSQSFDKNGNKVYVGDPSLLSQGKACSAKDQSGCYKYNGVVNVIPPNLIDPNMQKMMNIFPLPNRPCTTYAACKAAGQIANSAPYNFLLQPGRDQPTHQTVLRVDFDPTSKWRTFFRGMDMSNETRGNTATANFTPWGIPGFYQTPARNASFNVTYAATPTLINEFTIGYADWKEEQGFADASGPAQLEKKNNGVTLGQNDPAQNPLGLVPRITGHSSPSLGKASGSTVFGIGNAPYIDFDNRFPMKNGTGTWEGTEGLTKVWRSHTAKTGVYFQSSRYLQRHIGSVFDGSFDFQTNSSNPRDTQFAFANMLTGNYFSYQEGSTPVNYAPHWKVLEWYVQDNWKARPNLTLEYGLRFSYDIPTTLAPGYGAAFVASTYDPSQVPALYRPVLYKNLSAALQKQCRGGAVAVPSTCAQNPRNPNDVKPNVAVGSYVSPFSYTGSIINTNPNYPRALRFSNGVLYAPRVGLSWDPFGDGRTAVRLGAGIYYQTRTEESVGDYSLIAPLVTNPTVNYGTVSTFTPNCGSAPGGCTGGGALNSPQETRVLEPHRKMQSTTSVNFGVQRKVAFDTVVDVSYVGTFGRHLNQQYDMNEVPYLAQFNTANADPTATPKSFFTPNSPLHVTQQVALNDNFFRPILGYAAVNVRDYGGTSNYHSLQVHVDRRFSKGLQFGVSYTYSKAMTDADTVDGAVATYLDRRWWNYGEAQFDRTHNLVLHWVASLPKPGNLWNNRIFKAVADNWEWSGIAEFVSGAPIEYQTGAGVSGKVTSDTQGLNITGGGDGFHLLQVGKALMPADQVHRTKQYANPAAFILPPVGVIPNPGIPGITRNDLFRGPGTNNWDMALQKNIRIKERVTFTLRGEAYNAFNHVSFNKLDTTAHFDTSTATGNGQPTASSTFGQVIGDRGARILQLSGRITF
jgi:hypothetical protein